MIRQHDTKIRSRKSKHWRGVEVTIALVLFSKRVSLTSMPFAWNRPLFSLETRKGMCGEIDRKLHIYLGPLHLWTMESVCTQFAVELEFDHNPFWRERPQKRKT